jgi:hypothetical protein
MINIFCNHGKGATTLPLEVLLPLIPKNRKSNESKKHTLQIVTTLENIRT